MDEAQPKRTYHVWTVGCQMNVSDSERLEAALQAVGYTPVEQPEAADFVVLNSCSVRESAETRIKGKLGSLKTLKDHNPNMQIVLWGCMVGPNNESIFKGKLSMVDHFVSPSAVDEVVALLPNPVYQFDEPVLPIASHDHPPVTVHVPIIYGCNMNCSYCVIPLRRGRERSRPLAEIVEECRRIVSRGAREITLLGQIVDSYGHDLPGRPDLADLLEAVHETPGLLRLRFLTSHPAWISQKLIDMMARLPKCMPEINLPIQTGHNDLLKVMKRGYTVERYTNIVEQIRAAIPHVSITTDIIVGHPGETDIHFQGTLETLERVRWGKVHVAAFSSRPGTRAAEMELDPNLEVPYWKKQLRRVELDKLQGAIQAEANAAWLDQAVEVLVEDQVRGQWRGRSPQNRLVYFSDAGDWIGKLARVHVTRTGPWSLSGELVPELVAA
ncbi:MAG: tRNA (N6-isopentenyl adenosine(37)-C2)-methylthiotransferase MiaB [Herpetosiphonaceae bacterium]|nr:tRNA (N6-isopentenyl adenosine(37)-C2)-methylthiotransferase MiaB [Herpetosiphonaceae bacterium]